MLFSEMDMNDNQEIDINEYMAFIYMADKIKVKNQRTKDTVFFVR
jgi:hypothetical protein